MFLKPLLSGIDVGMLDELETIELGSGATLLGAGVELEMILELDTGFSEELTGAWLDEAFWLLELMVVPLL